ncbi:hypothetical protein TNCV_2478441 [Trichonephila clavipes]|nr:hypothetical protein TNCV_2478441 [Trichonephila clavipes]
MSVYDFSIHQSRNRTLNLGLSGNATFSKGIGFYLSVSGSEKDSEITDCFKISVGESESSDDGSVLLPVMLVFLSHA